MKGKRYSEDQILSILREIEEGAGVMATCRKHGVSQVTVHRWRGKYGGMGRSELSRMKELERENARLRKIVSDQALKIVVLEEVSKGKW